jgi:hypothetical protein
MWMQWKRIAVASFVGLGLLGRAAMAEEPAQKKPTIRRRQKNQQKRIGEGVENGQLTPKETAKIEHQEAALNKEIRHDRKDGGGLTPKERRRINRQQDKLSKEIYKEKHDNDKVPPAK